MVAGGCAWFAGEACIVAGSCAWRRGGMPGEGGACMVKGGCAWWGGMHGKGGHAL